VTSLAAQAGKSDASLDYLMTLQRALIHNPQNTSEQHKRFCGEFEQTLSEMRVTGLAKQLGDDKSFDCDKLLADTGSTPYERPQFVWLRRRLEPRISSAIESLGKKLPNEPTIGTVPLPLLNAKTILPPGSNRPVIVLNDEIFRLPYDITRATMQAIGFGQASNGLTMTSVDPKEIAASLPNHPDAVQGVKWATLRYLHQVSGGPNDSYLTVDNDLDFVKNVLFIEGLTDAIETFVLCHEYAHIVLGHNIGDASALNLTSAHNERVEVNEATYSWRQEFEADAYGFLMMDEVLKQQAVLDSGNYFKNPLYPFYLYGPRFFFSLMAFVESAKAYIETGAAAPGPSKEDVKIAKLAISEMFSSSTRPAKHGESPHTAATHPPFLFRAAQAKIIEQKALSLFLEKAELEPGTKSVYRMSEAFDGALEALFVAATPDFEQRYKNPTADGNILQRPSVPQTKALPRSDPSDLSPAALREELRLRGVDLSAASKPGGLRDALVEYDFVAGKGTNLNSDNEEVLKAIQDLNLGLKQISLQSHVSVHTKEPGARVVYRLIGGGDSLQLNELTNHAEDDIPVGLYFVWAERNGHVTSPKTAKFKIIQTRTSIDLEESKP
jgi:hypothetical protein